MEHVNTRVSTLILFLMLIVVLPQVAAQDAHVRVISGNPATRTYTFSCDMAPNTGYLRDFFVRPDYGSLNVQVPNEAESLDRAQGDHFTYTFKENRFYHVGCIIVNASNFNQLFRGDLHIDLRTSAWNPNIVPISGNGKSSTLRCDYSSNYAVSWEVLNAQTGQVTNLGTQKTITHTVQDAGLYDYICHVLDLQNNQNFNVGLPIEYFNQGNPYFPDNKGIPQGIGSSWIRNSSSTSSDTQTQASNSTCAPKVTSLTATCTGGTITQDTNNGCRTLVCASGANSIKVLACDKPDNSLSPQKVEMYKQSSTGTPPKLCLGTVCVQGNGFASGNYPICGATTPTNTTPNTTTPPATNTTNTSACFSSVQNAPVSCAGGTFTQDTFNGCRTLTCTNGASTMKVQACNKGSFFEMYKQSQTGNVVTKICIGTTCISSNGYAKGDFASCTQPNTSNTGSNPAPLWIEPSEGLTGVTPDYFHINVLEPSNVQDVLAADFEVWNNAMTERVWSAINNTGTVKFHTHTPDGIFGGSLAGKGALNYLTMYKVRARFRFANGNTAWSTWRTFTTKAQPQAGTSITWTAVPGFKVERFATGLDVPVQLAFAPPLYNSYPQSQRPYLYVTELYGKVKVIYQDGSSSVYADNLLNFDPLGSITGGGQMGVIGLYVDNVTGDLFVSMVYVEGEDTVKNKVVRFTTSDNGRTFTAKQTIIDNLPSAPSHQVEQITKGPDGKIYVNLGEGDNSNNAQNDNIRAGKIIRMNMDGTGVETYAKGFRNPFGADWRPGFNKLYVTDNSPDSNDRLIKVDQGGNYGWCCDITKRIAVLNVSPVDVEFNLGNTGFPSGLTGKMYVAVGGPIYQKGPTQGKHIIEYTLDNNGDVASARQFVWYTGTGYGTPIGLDFGPDGLYFTDIYGEPGFIGNGKTEGNIYRIVQGTPDGTPQPGQFRAGISVIPWYPKDTGNGIEYIYECQGIDGSGNYRYDYNFGDGSQTTNINSNRVGPKTYPYGDRDYTISCTVKDQQTGKQASASMVINPDDFIPEK